MAPNSLPVVAEADFSGCTRPSASACRHDRPPQYRHRTVVCPGAVVYIKDIRNIVLRECRRHPVSKSTALDVTVRRDSRKVPAPGSGGADSWTPGTHFS